MRECRFGVNVDELAGGQQAQRDLLRDTSRKRAQLPTNLGIEAAWVQVLGQRGTIARPYAAGAVRIFPSLRSAGLSGPAPPAAALVGSAISATGPIPRATAIPAGNTILAARAIPAADAILVFGGSARPITDIATRPIPIIVATGSALPKVAGWPITLRLPRLISLIASEPTFARRLTPPLPTGAFPSTVTVDAPAPAINAVISPIATSAVVPARPGTVVAAWSLLDTPAGPVVPA